jgi:NAD(P)-dependent dehydrogenase (short-subunit alcohol dehydrogenase family)
MDSKQVVLITGSSTGFGRLIADTLARHGPIVFATMRDPEGRNVANAVSPYLPQRMSRPLSRLASS